LSGKGLVLVFEIIDDILVFWGQIRKQTEVIVKMANGRVEPVVLPVY
jgi:hypothetical protein